MREAFSCLSHASCICTKFRRSPTLPIKARLDRRGCPRQMHRAPQRQGCRQVMTFPRQKTHCCSPGSLGHKSATPRLTRSHWQHTCTAHTLRAGPLQSPRVPSYLLFPCQPFPVAGLLRRMKALGSPCVGVCPAASLLPLWTPHCGPEGDDAPSCVWCEEEVQLHHYDTWLVPPQLCAVPLLSDWADPRS